MKKLLIIAALVAIPAVSSAHETVTDPITGAVTTLERQGFLEDRDPSVWILIGFLLGGGLVFTLEQLTQDHWKHSTKKRKRK